MAKFLLEYLISQIISNWLIFPEVDFNMENLDIPYEEFIERYASFLQSTVFRILIPVLWPDWIYRHTKYFKIEMKHRAYIDDLMNTVSSSLVDFSEIR
jgi:hypothetical protein